MFRSRTSSDRPLRRRVGLAAASAAALTLPFLGAAPAGAAPGDLDTAFSGDGLQIGPPQSGNATASYLQADGKLVVAGSGFYDDGTSSKTGTYISRWDASGNVDSTFGPGGTRIVNAVTGVEVVRGIAPIGTGSIVVGYGSATYPDDSDIYLVKVNSAGTPATTFGGDGIVNLNFGNHDRVGGIVVKGTRAYVALSQDDGGNWANKWTVLAINTSTGAIDTTFSGDGKAEVPTSKLSTYDSLRSIALQSDGKILLGGASTSQYAVARFTSAGALDTTFSGDGVTTTSVEGGGSAYKMLLQKDGKIVLAGTAYGTGRSDTDMAAVRFTAAGALDTTFSTDGKVLVDGGQKLNDGAFTAALAKDDKILLGGFSYTSSTGMDFGLFRLNWNGTEDKSFSGDGKATVNTLATSNEQVETITMGAADRIYAIGENLNGWSLAAVQGDAAPTFSVADASVKEPDAGTANLTFTVKLSAPSTSSLTVKYATKVGTATAADFTAKSGTLTIAAGATSGTVVVPVKGENLKEANETFTLELSAPINAGISDASAVGTITNDD